MSTIRDRAGNFLNKLHDKAGYGKVVTASDLERFAASERNLQRKECAEAYCDTANDNRHSCFIQSVYDAILTAGIEPQTPFGCSCWTSKDGVWYRPSINKITVKFLDGDEKVCDQCGAKRKEKSTWPKISLIHEGTGEIKAGMEDT